MSGVRQGSHLEHLLELRGRVDEEITKERVRAKIADERRAAQAAAREKQQREAQRAARRAAARAEREEAAVARLREAEYIEAAAPADVVRAWARANRIAVGDHGRLPLDLRRRYLAANQTTQESA